MGVMWLQVITVVISSFCSSVPASNDLEPAGTIGPPKWNTSIECSSGDKFYWSHLSLQCWETSAEEMALQYFRSLADVIHCANVKLHFPEPCNTLKCYLQQSNDHRNLTHTVFQTLFLLIQTCSLLICSFFNDDYTYESVFRPHLWGIFCVSCQLTSHLLSQSDLTISALIRRL